MLNERFERMTRASPQRDSMNTKIEGTPEAWEDRSLGADPETAKADTGPEGEAIERQIDEALGLKMISIRLPEQLIEDFKMIAAVNGGMGYQTLMRQVLRRFATAELKQMARETMSQRQADSGHPAPEDRRRAA